MKVHVLTGGSDGGSYTIVVHTPTPAGNNSAGFPWSTVIQLATKPSSMLSVGTGPGQTTQQEVNDIAAGLVLEATFQFIDDPSIGGAARNNLLDTLASSAAAAMLSRLQSVLKWYGVTRP